MRVESNIDDVISQLRRSADRAVEQAMKELEKTAFEIKGCFYLKQRTQCKEPFRGNFYKFLQ